MYRRSLLGRAFGILALLVTTLSLGTATTGVASASTTASCSHAGCRGLDPQASGCSSGAYTLDSFTAHWGSYVELRFSPDCGAYWTRITPARNNRDYTAWTQASSDSSYYETQVSGNCWYNGTGVPCDAVWTPMTTNALVRSCHSSDAYECTEWHVTSMG